MAEICMSFKAFSLIFGRSPIGATDKNENEWSIKQSKGKLPNWGFIQKI